MKYQKFVPRLLYWLFFLWSRRASNHRLRIGWFLVRASVAKYTIATTIFDASKWNNYFIAADIFFLKLYQFSLNKSETKKKKKQ